MRRMAEKPAACVSRVAVAVPGRTFRHFLLGAAEMVLILTKHPDADLTPFRSTYLAHLRQRAEAYRDLSRRLFGRDIHQVMLLHHNLITLFFSMMPFNFSRAWAGASPIPQRPTRTPSTASTSSAKERCLRHLSEEKIAADVADDADGKR